MSTLWEQHVKIKVCGEVNLCSDSLTYPVETERHFITNTGGCNIILALAWHTRKPHRVRPAIVAESVGSLAHHKAKINAR